MKDPIAIKAGWCSYRMKSDSKGTFDLWIDQPRYGWFGTTHKLIHIASGISLEQANKTLEVIVDHQS